jgi:hypothetical protein
VSGEVQFEATPEEAAKIIADLDARGWTVPELSLTGFTSEEIEDLLKAAHVPDDAEVVEGGSLGVEREPQELDEAGGPFELTIAFGTKDELQRAKRGLRKVAGKGRELGEGLLNLLDEQE